MFTRTIHSLLVTTLIALTSVIQPLRLTQGQSVAASNDGTVIAFVKSSRDNQAIHMVNPDGSNDREIWRVPSPVLSANGVGYVAWNPDASEIAFDSGHITASLTIRDIYAVKPNGTGLRRITNAPHPSTFNSFPKGKVAVSVYNVGASGKILQAYIEGAAAPIQWEAAGGSRRDLLFEDVADYGDGVKQYVVFKDETNRCSYDLVANADVKSGQTTRTVGDINVYDSSVPQCVQPYHPAWSADGTQLGYLVHKQGIAASFQNNFWLSPAVNVPPTNKGQEVIPLPPSVSDERIINFFALGPTANRANEILFDRQNLTNIVTGLPHILKAPINDPALAEEVILDLKEPCPYTQGVQTACRALGLAWLPDGSGFVFSLIAKDLISSNKDVNYLYRYDFATQATTRIAALGNGLVTDVTISPDMQKVAYARALNGDAAFDIWVIDMNGANNQKIVSDARSPAWSPKPPTSSQPGATPTPAPTVAGPTPTVNPNLSVRVYLPLVLQASQLTPPQPTATTPAGQPTATPSASGLINGNFEQGRNVGWVEYSSILTNVIAIRNGFIVPHSGQYVADLSDKTRALNEASAISQTVTLPSGASTLNFFYRWDSEDSTCSGDKAELIISNGTAQEALWTLILCSNNYESNNWMAKSVDVSRFAGKTISILFRSQTNAQGPSELVIDDVSLSTSGTAATPTPTTPPNATATPTPPASGVGYVK